ncbi:MAG: 3-deoxy-D-manno-octulosonic acid transferase [Phycisphaerae bacterium]|nr:3-deoxy-D-manno-octulosonic acid transferase [Phycisphaerae bacterium]
MSLVYDLVYALALLVGWPYLLYRRIMRGPSTSTLNELLGGVPSRPVASRCVWIHGVSLGEINATQTLVADIRRRSPDTVVAISSTTRTGLERARGLYPNHTVFRFPLDLSFALRRAFGRIRPHVIVLMELEAWPNLLLIAEQRGIPVVIANGRVTEGKSMRRFRLPLVRRAARMMFGRVSFVAAQDASYAARFVELGVPARRVMVTGSLKYDTAEVSERIAGQEQLAEAMSIDAARPLLVAGSTGTDEEALVLDAFDALRRAHPDVQLAIVPRKPERFDEVARLIASRGFVCLRRSSGTPVMPAVPEPGKHVFLGDTMGELRKFYGLASVVFVGRTLVPMGGSDVMEVAGLGKPLLVGPHTENFAEAVALLSEAGACICVSDAASLARAAGELLADAERRRRMGEAGRAAIVSRQGATQRTVDRLLEFLP